MKKLTKLIFLIVIIMQFQNCDSNKVEPLVIGHRGAMGHETENTLASVQKAVDMNVDMIEIDVFKIKSGEIVVFHDKELKPLTNTEGAIEEFDLPSLKKVIVKGGHTIPTLQEVIQTIDKKTRINIELKGSGTTKDVLRIVNENIQNNRWDLQDFLISSFKWDELRKMRELDKLIPIAVLTEEDPVKAISVAKELEAVAINPDFSKINASNVKIMQEAKFKVYTWTVNEPSDIEKALIWGVDGIITNYPERVK